MIERVVEGNRTSILLSTDGQEVSRASVLDLQMRVGNIPVRLGGIAGVSTEREHRGKGYSRQVLNECLAFQQEAGFDLSALFGIPDYYPKYGYASAFMEAAAEVRLRYAERAQIVYATRPMVSEDLPVIRAIYNQMTKARTATLVREDDWTGFRRGSDWKSRFAVEMIVDGNIVLGYMLYEQNLWQCDLIEAGYVGPKVFSTMLALMARDALEKRIDTIKVFAAPDDSFLAYCRRYGYRLNIDYPAQASGMARVINQSNLLHKMEPLFSQRLQQAGCEWAGKLVVETDLGTDQLDLGPNDTRTLRVPQWMLAQLVLGYRSVEDAAFETEAEIAKEDLPILDILFPEGFPYMWITDHF